ncbi:MAG: hypothetical protein IPO91_19320 [Chloroflexi bacterium]|jgi:hypothetical protein|nr:hypothetical protein [Chloroflexota bacterium]
MSGHIIAVDTYGAQRVTDPRTHQLVSAYKLGYTSAVSAVLLALYGDKARNVSPKQASYHYVQIDGDVVVRHGHILLTLTDAELARAEQITRQSYRAGVFLWRDNQWWTFPDSSHPDYTAPGYRSGPNFDPTGFRPPSPSTGEHVAAVSGIVAERSQRSATEKPWWWLSGETYPHRDLLKRYGARFSSRRKQWYYIGADLPAAIRALMTSEMRAETTDGQVEPVTPLDPLPLTVETTPIAPAMSPALVSLIEQALADDDAPAQPTSVDQPAEPEPLPAIRITKPSPLPADGEPLDAVQTALREVQRTPFAPICRSVSSYSPGRAVPITQQYCGELTGSITGQVFCYGWAMYEGVCVYVNMGGPRTGVEAIRAKLSKGDIVTVVPDAAPAIELTAGEGNSGMYHDYLHTIPEARFTSLILLHEWVVNPNYSGNATTFILRTDEAQAQAKLKHYVAQVVNVPVFDAWTSFLWSAGYAAMLVRPTRSAGGIDLLTVSLDALVWTRLITGGLEQRTILLPS